MGRETRNEGGTVHTGDRQASRGKGGGSSVRHPSRPLAALATTVFLVVPFLDSGLDPSPYFGTSVWAVVSYCTG